MKNFIITLIVIIIIGVGAYFLFTNLPTNAPATQDQGTMVGTNETGNGEQAGAMQGGEQNGAATIIGKSVEGRDIAAYSYGSGDKKILFIGGIHGGYEWNTALVAYEAMDYLKANPDSIPSGVAVTIIPVLNPDGLNHVVGTATRFAASDVSASQTVQISGRFNGNKVDLNRNFDCDWKSTGTWQNTSVSGGSAAFSEPESQALKAYIENQKPTAVVVWFSAAGGVYASNCHSGISQETSALTKVYADASGYPAFENFDFYAITGDVTNWLAKQNIPAISVLLTNHTDTEWTKNLAGIKALLAHYAQ